MTDLLSGRIALDLLDRYLADECAPTERAAVEAWLDRNFEHRAILKGLRELRLVDGALSPERIDTAWKSFSVLWLQELASPSSASRAASSSRLATTGGRSSGRVAAVRAASPGSSRFAWRGIVAAAAVAVVAGALGGTFATRWNTQPRTAEAPAPRTFSTTKGQRATIQLVDGSRVTLGPESRVELAPDFSSGGRSVHVDGAAYFEVTHDPATPFVVRSGDAVVQVIGTAFSVEQYRGDSSVSVVVAQGKVAVRSSDGGSALSEHPPTVVTQGESAEFLVAQQTVIRQSIDPASKLAWLTGELRFNRVPLREVTRVLERWYDVTIMIPDTTLAEQQVTATFGREGIPDIIRQLTKALGARHQVRGNTVVILPGS